MKLLLDECLPLDFRHSFPEHEAHTVQWAGFKRKRNGELLRSAELGGYDVFLTVDQGIRFQQVLAGRNLSVVVIRSYTNQMEDLLPLVESISIALGRILPSEVIEVP